MVLTLNRDLCRSKTYFFQCSWTWKTAFGIQISSLDNKRTLPDRKIGEKMLHTRSSLTGYNNACVEQEISLKTESHYWCMTKLMNETKTIYHDWSYLNQDDSKIQWTIMKHLDSRRLRQTLGDTIQIFFTWYTYLEKVASGVLEVIWLDKATSLNGNWALSGNEPSSSLSLVGSTRDFIFQTNPPHKFDK